MNYFYFGIFYSIYILIVCFHMMKKLCLNAYNFIFMLFTICKIFMNIQNSCRYRAYINTLCFPNIISYLIILLYVLLYIVYSILFTHSVYSAIFIFVVDIVIIVGPKNDHKVNGPKS